MRTSTVAPSALRLKTWAAGLSLILGATLFGIEMGARLLLTGAP